MAIKHAKKYIENGKNGKNDTWGSDLRGQFYHPAAYARLPNCSRDLRRAVPHAALCDAKLHAEVWGPDYSRPAPAAFVVAAE